MPDALVLCYHALSPDWPAVLSVTPQRFERQAEAIAARGYRSMRFTDLVDAGARRGKVVAITFDDAYRSVHRVAWPIMRRRGLVGTVFVPTDFPGTERPMSWKGIDHWADGPHASDMVPMSWDELRELRDAGWEVGSHTCSHPHLTSLDDPELARQLRESREVCEEKMGEACASIAYPYGDVDERVIRVAGEQGYRTAGTLPSVIERPRPLAWPRVGVYHEDHQRRFLLKVSPLSRRVRGSRAYRALRDRR